MNLKNTSILVTGGTGFIGRALVRAFVTAGARVRTFDNDWRGSQKALGDLSSQVEMVQGDIRDAQSVRQAVRGMQSVYHLAAINGTQNFYAHPDLVLGVGIKGILNVMDACIEEGVRDFGLASTSEVYQTPSIVPTPETVPLIVPDPTNARYSYGGSKIISELLALHYGQTHFDRVVIFRPHNVYGPQMGWEHVIPELILRTQARVAPGATTITLPIQGTGQEKRSFVFIDDLVQGVLLLFEQGQNLGIYHIGTQDEITIAALAEAIGQAFSVRVQVQPGERRAGGTLRRCPDISKIRALGYAPRVSLTEGLRQTIAWYRDHPRPEPLKEN